ncbi:MAG: four helix bundle protein [Firmicutes bacterium]|nr:four helix bundle protein [Bacillota bacterium]
MRESIIKEKSFKFAIRIVNLYKFLREEKGEHIISKQLMRSGTSIGANVSEADRAVSKKDFINKSAIALKEANESEYWIELLHKTDYLSNEQYESLKGDIAELNKILIAIVKRSSND